MLSLANTRTSIAAGNHVTFVESPASPHTMEWNADPERIVLSVETWLAEVDGKRVA
jgi:hypothetical protein